jgi:hypothetical protein
VKLDASDIHDLKPVIAAVVAEVLANADKLNGRLAFPEAEAAALCGLPKHVLRDCRLRGEIRGRLVGKKTVYEKSELLKFLRS